MRIAALSVTAGLVLLAASPAAAVTGGSTAKAGSYPWLGALTSPAAFMRPNGHFCGGVLVKPNKVLTAAHCARQFKWAPSTLSVTFGRTDIGKRKGGTTVKVKKIWINPSYRTTDLNGLDVERDAIAVLTLSRKLKIKPVRLGSVAGGSGFVLGWGVTSRVVPGNTKLRKAHVPLISNAACNAAFPGAIDGGMVCSNGAKAAFCQFDTGGPLVVKKKVRIRVQGQFEDRYVDHVVGISSWYKGCAEGKPSVYARVSAFKKALAKQL